MRWKLGRYWVIREGEIPENEETRLTELENRYLRTRKPNTLEDYENRVQLLKDDGYNVSHLEKKIKGWRRGEVKPRRIT